MSLRPLNSCLVVIAISQLSSSSIADESENLRVYIERVKPVVRERCIACHGALKQESNLRLDTAASIVRNSSERSAVAVAGDVENSTIVARITSTDSDTRMPPEGEPLTAEQIADVQSWIEGGASAPHDEVPEASPSDHWAFRAPIRPSVPQFEDASYDNPIDAFLEQSRRTHEIIEVDEADRLTLLRRVTLDLTGLPPSAEDQDCFLNDTSIDAYEQTVDRLLASPQFGERQARHWMDVWRYSDWWGLGAEVRNSQKHIWHWRDWIVESLNADLGYDRMWQDMLAVDELAPNDLSRLRASGFLARQYFKFNRTTWLDDTIQHTFKASLGLTFNCAKCHDHKYDPISQLEYYQLRSFFEPAQLRTDLIPGETDPEKDGIPRAFDCNLEAVTHLHIRGDDRNPDLSLNIQPVVPTFLSFADFPITAVSLPPDASNPGLRESVVQTLLGAADRDIESARAEASRAESESTAARDDTRLQIVLQIAHQRLRTAELARAAVIARAEADRVMDTEATSAGEPNVEDSSAAATAAKAASLSERTLACEQAVLEQQLAHLAVRDSSPETKAAAEMKLTEAENKVATSRAALSDVSVKYRPLVGAVKTLESNLETEESKNARAESRQSQRLRDHPLTPK